MRNNPSGHKGELDWMAISVDVSFPLMRKMMFGRLCPLTRLPSRRTSFSPRRLFILRAPPVMGRTLTNALALAKVPPRQHNRFDLRCPLASFISIFATFPNLFCRVCLTDTVPTLIAFVHSSSQRSCSSAWRRTSGSASLR